MTERPASGPLDILSDIGPIVKGPTCEIAKLRRDQPELATQYDRAFAARRAYDNGEAGGRFLTDSQIAEWFTTHGYRMGAWTVKRHRKGECLSCRG